MGGSVLREFKRLEEKYRLLDDSLIDAIWIVDAESLKYEYITPSIEKISGFSPEELIGTSIVNKMAPESYHKARELIAEEKAEFLAGKNNIRTTELELLHKDGTPYWTEIRAKIVQESGKPMKIIGVSREISARKKAERAQERLIEKLTRVLEEKDKLLQEVTALRRLLPICSACKRIRDEDGRWWPLDAYVTRKTASKVTHTICGDCKDVFYGDPDKSRDGSR